MSKPNIAIVDTGSGNLRSVEKALALVGADPVVTQDADRVARADKIVVPGQGAFGACMAGLSRNGGALREAVLATIRAGKLCFGICIGMQVLFESSEEEPNCAGLGLLRGRVEKFRVSPPLKIPHMGWNACRRVAGGASSPILDGTADGTYFYFVHSFYPVPADPREVALRSDHGGSFCAAVARDNLFACQFHPEKSQRAGIGLLSRFVSI
jgi:imidazole glycerol-phosphate synthase subunit HisH